MDCMDMPRHLIAKTSDLGTLTCAILTKARLIVEKRLDRKTSWIYKLRP